MPFPGHPAASCQVRECAGMSRRVLTLAPLPPVLRVVSILPVKFVSRLAHASVAADVLAPPSLQAACCWAFVVGTPPCAAEWPSQSSPLPSVPPDSQPETVTCDVYCSAGMQNDGTAKPPCGMTTSWRQVASAGPESMIVFTPAGN